MEQPIGEKKPKRVWCPHNQVKKVVQKKVGEFAWENDVWEEKA